MKKVFALVMAFALCLMPLAAQAAQIVQPTEDFYVYDGADVLSLETEGHIILNNDALYEACGAQIVFVTLDTTGSTILEDYAYDLFNTWGIGSKDKQNGLLVIMTIYDDDYWLLQGSGLEDYLSSGDLGAMADKYLEPYFARKDYDAGAKALFNALFERVSGIYGANVRINDSLGTSSLSGEEPAQVYPGTQGIVHSSNAGDFVEGVRNFFGVVLIIIVIVLALVFARLMRGVRPRKAPRTTMWSSMSRPYVRPPQPPQPPIPPHPPIPPMGGFGMPGSRPANRPSSGFGGSRPSSFGSSRPSSFGSSRPSSFGSNRPSSFGSSRPSSFGGSRSGGFGGGRSGGGGGSRGGGAGRGR